MSGRIPSYPSLLVRKVEGEGRGVFYEPHSGSTEICKTGTTLLRITPLACAMDNSVIDTSCSHCAKRSDQPKEFKRCTQCRFTRYCSKACQTADWKKAHKHECKALQNWNAQSNKMDQCKYYPRGMKPDGQLSDYPDITTRLLARLLWQGQRTRKDYGVISFDQLESHFDKKMQDRELAEVVEYESRRVAQFVALSKGTNAVGDTGTMISTLEDLGLDEPESELMAIVAKYQLNAVTVVAPSGSGMTGLAVSPLFSLFNHSCHPNAILVFPTGMRGGADTDFMRIVAVRDIQPGEQIKITYMDLSDPFQTRDQNLRRNYFFKCCCRYCENARVVQQVLRAGGKNEGKQTYQVDPREALWCPREGCRGWTPRPGPDCVGPVEVVCDRCREASTIADPQALNAALEAACQAIKSSDAKIRQMPKVTSTVLRKEWFGTILPNFAILVKAMPPSSHLLNKQLDLLRVFMVLFLNYPGQNEGKEPSAPEVAPDSSMTSTDVERQNAAVVDGCIQLALLQVAAMKSATWSSPPPDEGAKPPTENSKRTGTAKRAPAEPPGEVVYGRAHPGRGFTLATLGRWLLVDLRSALKRPPPQASASAGADAPTLFPPSVLPSGFLPPLPPRGAARAKWSREIMQEALECCRLAAGHDELNGGELGEECQRLLAEIDEWEAQVKSKAAAAAAASTHGKGKR